MDPLLNVALLVRACGTIEGRKKLQKIVHILQESGEPFRERFGMLHYGPYSSELKGELDFLVDGGLIDEKGSGNNYEPYVYSPGEKLNELLENVGAESVPSWAQTAQDLNRLDARELEAVSTILFLKRRDFDGERLKDRFEKIKPQLADRFDKALRLAAKYVPTAA